MDNMSQFLFGLSCCKQKSAIKLVNTSLLEFMENMVNSKYCSSKTITHLLNTAVNLFSLSPNSFRKFGYLTKPTLLKKFLLSKFVSVKTLLFEPLINLIQVPFVVCVIGSCRLCPLRPWIHKRFPIWRLQAYSCCRLLQIYRTPF